MATLEQVNELKAICREDAMPFFSPELLNSILTKHGDDVNRAAYECLILKSENTGLTMGNLSVADTSEYFRRLARFYRPTNSGVLRGVF